MTNCPNCAAPIPPEAIACDYCGTTFKMRWQESLAAAEAFDAIAGIGKLMRPSTLRHAADLIRENARKVG